MLAPMWKEPTRKGNIATNECTPGFLSRATCGSSVLSASSELWFSNFYRFRPVTHGTAQMGLSSRRDHNRTEMADCVENGNKEKRQ